MLYRKILVPLDGSAGAWKALRRAFLLAKAQRAEVTALSVEEHLPHFPATLDEVAEEQDQENAYFARVHAEALQLAAEQGVTLHTVIRPGHAAQIIVQFASEEACDLIVIGHSGHSGIWGMLLGSTTDRVVDHAHCDVLVVR